MKKMSSWTVEPSESIKTGCSPGFGGKIVDAVGVVGVVGVVGAVSWMVRLDGSRVVRYRCCDSHRSRVS